MTETQSLNQKPKYIIFRKPEEYNRYFRQCKRLKIPFLAVSRRGGLSTVEFDLFTVPRASLTAAAYKDLLAIRDDLFKRELARDVLTSCSNGFFKVKAAAEAEMIQQLLDVISNPANWQTKQK